MENQTKDQAQAQLQQPPQKDAPERFTVYDWISLIFYGIILAVGVMLCVTKGLDARPSHLFAVTVSLFGILAMRLAKYRGQLRKHLSELIVPVLLCLLALVAAAALIAGGGHLS